MATDIEGYIFNVGDKVYTCEAVRGGSKAKRLVECEVLSISESGLKCKVKMLETGRQTNKLCSNVVVPAGNLL